MPISPGVAFKAKDVPELPDPLKQKYYRSFVAKLQFAATWIRSDISFAVSQLARFCTSAGTAQWAALHHLMEYLSNQSSFKITYHRGMKLVDLLSGYADADWGNIPQVDVWHGYAVQQVADHVEVEKTTVLSEYTAVAEHYSALAAGC